MSVIVSDVKKQLFYTENKPLTENLKAGEQPHRDMRE